MELTFYTDYSLRVLMYVGARPGRLCLISDIASDYGISRNHLVKVVHGLARGGFLATYRGRGGGVTLSRDPADIRLGDVVRYSEGPIKPVTCFYDRELCVISPACMLPAILSEAVASFLATLDRYTLADLLTHRRHLLRLLSGPAKTLRQQTGRRPKTRAR